MTAERELFNEYKKRRNPIFANLTNDEKDAMIEARKNAKNERIAELQRVINFLNNSDNYDMNIIHSTIFIRNEFTMYDLIDLIRQVDNRKFDLMARAP